MDSYELDPEREREIERQYDQYGVYFGGMSDVSQAALKREKQTKALFHQAKEEARPALLSLPKGEKHVMEDYAPPKYHLTAYTWKTFRPWVEQHSGWKATRRVATPDEVADYEQEEEGNRCPSRGKSYYISFIYQDPSSIKKRNKKKAGDGEVEEEPQEPPVKKPKAEPLHSNGSLNLDSLPEQIQLHILSYCDVPTLGAVVPVSKNLCHLAKHNRLWEPHLRHLLRELFDGVLPNDQTTPLWQRTDWRQSSALLRWFQEAGQQGAFTIYGRRHPWYGYRHIRYDDTRKQILKFLEAANWYHRTRTQQTSPQRRQAPRACRRQVPPSDSMLERFDFLFTDVPTFREYYHKTGRLAFRSIQQGEDFTISRDHNKFCPECFDHAQDCPSEFENLPKIHWYA